MDAETDSEDEESEDEHGEELTPAVDAAILRTLARIKRKDPSIYNASADIFQGNSANRLLAIITFDNVIVNVEEQVKTGALRLSRLSKDKVLEIAPPPYVTVKTQPLLVKTSDNPSSKTQVCSQSCLTVTVAATNHPCRRTTRPAR